MSGALTPPVSQYQPDGVKRAVAGVAFLHRPTSREAPCSRRAGVPQAASPTAQVILPVTASARLGGTAAAAEAG